MASARIWTGASPYAGTGSGRMWPNIAFFCVQKLWQRVSDSRVGDRAAEQLRMAHFRRAVRRFELTDFRLAA